MTNGIPKIGDKAPLFTLRTKDASGIREVKLEDNFGVSSTVLLFFPFAFTSVCTAELCGVSAGLGEYAELNAVVYGISVDSPFAQEAFAKASRITFPLLSDFNKEVSAAYGVLFPELLGLRGVAKRAAFVIDRQGIVAYSECSDNPTRLPDFDRVKSVLMG